MKLSLLIDGLITNETEDIEIGNISCDPKKCQYNTLLFLINEKAELEYIKHMPNVSAIITNNSFSLHTGAPTFKTSNIRATLSKAFAKMYCDDLSNIKFIGITGTNGKSTTAIMIKKVLCDCGFRVGLFGTGKITLGEYVLSDNDYSMTTPPPEILYPTIQKMQKLGVDVIVMEVSSHALMQERVAPINFDIGIFTNLSADHLDYHKNIDNYYSAKTSLMHQSKKVLVNSDDVYGQLALKQFLNTESCGTIQSASTKVANIKDLGLKGISFVYQSKKGSETINLAILGVYNVYNAMLAIRALECFNIPLINIKESLESIKKIDGRFEIVNEFPTIVIDYAHTAHAFENIVKSLYTCKKQGQNFFIVFGCGGERDTSKRVKMGEIADLYADEIILTSDNPRHESPLSIIAEIAKGISRNVHTYIDRKEAIKFTIKSAKENDIIAIIGKGPEKYTIVDDQYYEFDEKSIIKEALTERYT